MTTQAIEEFDDIVVGGGSAGCVMAARLSEDADRRVLLIEAGRRHRDLLLRMPIGVAKVYRNPKYNWSYRSEPEPFLDGRQLEHSRGKLVGGSAAINAMAYVRGNRADYERLSELGWKGWSYAEVLPYFKRSECFSGDPSVYRGTDGPWHVRASFGDSEVAHAFLAAGREFGYPTLADYNAAEQAGFAAHQHTIYRGRRVGNADAFLYPVLHRQNLSLRSSSTVTQLLVRAGRVVGVEYSADGVKHEALARRDVIVSCGTYNTPQLLMLSGIGPADELKRLEISPVLDLPGVGRNLWDHPMIKTVWRRKGEGWIHRELRLDRLLINMVRGIFGRTGFACEHHSSGTAFVRSSQEQEIPDIQLFCRDGTQQSREWLPFALPPATQAISFNAAHIRPQARGMVSLRSKNPFDAPKIVNNFLSSDHDRHVLRQAYRHMETIGQSTAFKDLIGEQLVPGQRLAADNEIDSYVRQTLVTVFHPAGTCKIGNDAASVVDSAFRVRGLEGLRIVDASVLPAPIGGNINAAVTMFAEKAADIIRGRPPLEPTRIADPSPVRSYCE
jgi:4-pyridoxate dehydrogenase